MAQEKTEGEPELPPRLQQAREEAIALAYQAGVVQVGWGWGGCVGWGGGDASGCAGAGEGGGVVALEGWGCVLTLGRECPTSQRAALTWY